MSISGVAQHPLRNPQAQQPDRSLARMAPLTIHQKRRRQEARDQNVLSQFGATICSRLSGAGETNAGRRYGFGRCHPGRTYVTSPGSAILFPALTVPDRRCARSPGNALSATRARRPTTNRRRSSWKKSLCRLLCDARRPYEGRQHDGGQQQRRDVAPQMSHVVAGLERFHRHDDSVHDARPHGEPDQADVGLRTSRRIPEEQAQRRVQADDHHEVVGLVRRAVMPCPPRRPHHGQRTSSNITVPKKTNAI